MVNLLKARKYIEMLYDCTCSIENLIDITDENTGITAQHWQIVVDEEPCRLSNKTITVTDVQDNASTSLKEIKLFIAPEIEIRAGSRIKVTDKQGVVKVYKRSGEPAVYTNHQEIVVELGTKWA